MLIATVIATIEWPSKRLIMNTITTIASSVKGEDPLYTAQARDCAQQTYRVVNRATIVHLAVARAEVSSGTALVMNIRPINIARRLRVISPR